MVFICIENCYPKILYSRHGIYLNGKLQPKIILFETRYIFLIEIPSQKYPIIDMVFISMETATQKSPVLENIDIFLIETPPQLHPIILDMIYIFN